jgi:glucokinase
MDNQFLLAGDIGGTKTVLALFSFEKGPRQPLIEVSYSSNSYSGLDSIIRDFFSKAAVSAATACFGVAGPVRDGKASITKLPWLLDSKTMQSAHGFSKATLINDLVATGYAIPHLPPEDLLTINDGVSIGEGAIGIIASGTGLGEAIFSWEGSHYIPVPS